MKLAKECSECIHSKVCKYKKKYKKASKIHAFKITCRYKVQNESTDVENSSDDILGEKFNELVNSTDDNTDAADDNNKASCEWFDELILPSSNTSDNTKNYIKAVMNNG